MKNDLPYLKHIVDAISKIEDYVKNVKREKFLKDAKTQDAVVRELEVIGEATKRLSGDIRQRYPGIPWAAVAGTRDRLIHAYFDVDLEEVWKTVRDDIPRLKRTVEKMIAGLER
jgi:uncharacterized protein with HEPN domain